MALLRAARNMAGKSILSIVIGALLSGAPAVALSAANDDYATTDENAKIRIRVTKNDKGFNTDNFQTKVTQAPTRGAATVLSDPNKIRYTPNANFVGRDTFVYRLTDNKGFSSTATVTVDVGCNPCGYTPDSGSGSGGTTTGRQVFLSWAKNPVSVSSYKVYYGPTGSTAVLKVAEISISNGLLDPNAPNVVLNSSSDLGAEDGDKICFRVKAFNNAGSSPKSAAICKVL